MPLGPLILASAYRAKFGVLPYVGEVGKSVMMQPKRKLQCETVRWKSRTAQDAAEILGLESCREIPTSAHVVLAAQLKLRQLRRELSARLSNPLQLGQVKTGLGAKADLPVEHVWVRIRRVQAARDKLLLLRRGLAGDGTISLAEN